MKKLYSTIIFLLLLSFSYSQNYELGLVNIGNYNFKVVAIPDFNTTTDTNNLDAGFTLMLPAGTADIINQVGLLGGRTWNVTQYDAAALVAAGGDGTQDAFLFNLPPGSTIFQHSMGQQIDLVSFDVTNMPVSGIIEFLANDDPLATAAGIFDSFYQTDLDGSGGMPTSDYFSGLAIGMESFDFATLSTNYFREINISIYPNPVKNTLKIKGLNNELSKIEIYTITGQLVSTINYNLTTVDVSGISPGVYLVKIYSGTRIKTIKLLKE